MYVCIYVYIYLYIYITKNANTLTLTDFEFALFNHDKVNFWKIFNKSADSKVVKYKDLKSSDFLNQFLDNFISSAGNTKALTEFLSVFNETREECSCFLVNANDVECAMKCINASQTLDFNNLYFTNIG